MRQGDPLAPLIFIFVIDALHEGIAKNPLVSIDSGYRFLQKPEVCVASLGFADDTMTFSMNWESAWHTHTWVREFCRAHNLNINWKKTRFYVSSWIKGDRRCLWPVQGDRYDPRTGTYPLRQEHQICARSPEEAFRYLGVFISMNLNWEVQLKKMDNIIQSHVRLMKSNRLQAHQKITMIKEMTLARLDPGLQVVEIPAKVLQKWNSTLTHCVVSCGLTWATAFSLNSQAINSLSGIPDLFFHYHARRVGEACPPKYS